MSELKPCPFCGREVHIKSYDADVDICWIQHVEKEPICYLWFAKGYTGRQADLIELWNRRAYENADEGKTDKGGLGDDLQEDPCGVCG